MEKNNKAIIIGLITLIVGLGIGYAVGASGSNERYEDSRQNLSSDTHMMLNGQMMGNGDNTTKTNSDTSMSGMMANMNAGLVGKTGDAFDQAFLVEMIVHHQGAVEMARLALTNTKHQEIKDLARAIIAAQNKEIAEMKAWQKNWYNQ